MASKMLWAFVVLSAVMQTFVASFVQPFPTTSTAFLDRTSVKRSFAETEQGVQSAEKTDILSALSVQTGLNEKPTLTTEQPSVFPSVDVVGNSNIQTEEIKASKKAESFKKTDFIAALSDKTGLNKKQSKEALEAVLEVIKEQVAKGQRIRFIGFGAFTLRARAARKGRNPQTGEELQIPASKSPGFSAAKEWKDVLNDKIPFVARTTTKPPIEQNAAKLPVARSSGKLPVTRKEVKPPAARSATKPAAVRSEKRAANSRNARVAEPSGARVPATPAARRAPLPPLTRGSVGFAAKPAIQRVTTSATAPVVASNNGVE